MTRKVKNGPLISNTFFIFCFTGVGFAATLMKTSACCGIKSAKKLTPVGGCFGAEAEIQLRGKPTVGDDASSQLLQHPFREGPEAVNEVSGNDLRRSVLR